MTDYPQNKDNVLFKKFRKLITLIEQLDDVGVLQQKSIYL